jgi:hypothetical protein
LVTASARQRSIEGPEITIRPASSGRPLLGPPMNPTTIITGLAYLTPAGTGGNSAW